MLELYHSPISTCSQKVRLALAEKCLPWHSRPINLAASEHLTEAYLRLNPNGVVPTLLHDGIPLTDSSAINEYLDDAFPHTPTRLRPEASPVEVARMRAWRQYIDEVPTPAVRVPYFNAFFVSRFEGLSDEQFAVQADRRPLRSGFYRHMGRTGFGQVEVDEALAKLRQTLVRMEGALANGPWLVGSMYSLADVSATPIVVRMEDLGLGDMWEDLPRVTEWYARIRARPSFEVAFMPGSRELGGGGDAGPAC